MARPTKLTKRVLDTILQSVEVGMPYVQCCNLVGIHYNTFLDWQKRGESDDAPKIFQDLSRGLEEAKAKGLRNNLVRIRLAGNTDWRAVAWLLERQFPEEFGKKVITETHLSTPSGPLAMETRSRIDLRHVSDDDLETLSSSLDRVLSGSAVIQGAVISGDDGGESDGSDL